MISNFYIEVACVTQNREIREFARRAALTEETEESASHHFLVFAFARLRAERPENDARSPRKRAWNGKFWNLGPQEILTFDLQPPLWIAICKFDSTPAEIHWYSKMFKSGAWGTL